MVSVNGVKKVAGPLRIHYDEKPRDPSAYMVMLILIGSISGRLRTIVDPISR
jgi:hypothetical protein